ncbi:MAG: hypothetical protein KDK70_12170, partial [Myxococcales bacterium]|nr:hypothetical protein [Myxococcales bacterium]
GPTRSLSGLCIGLDSGPVLSGSVGSKTVQRLDYTVLGITVSRALALGHRAARGQILLRQPVAEQLGALFDSRRLEDAEGGEDDVLGPLYNLERHSAHARPLQAQLDALTDTIDVSS